MKNVEISTPASILLQKIEKNIGNKSDSSENILSDSDILRLIKELHARQIELETQNQELLLAKNKAETEAKKYNNLYHFAPTANFTLTKKGEIVDLNIKTAELLGKERTLLLKSNFILFVSNDTKAVFNEFLEKTFKTNRNENCEIILLNDLHSPSYVLLNSVVFEDGTLCNITMIDITQRKTTELNLLYSDLILKSTIESQKDTIIFSIDLDYNYLTFNKTHADLMKQIYDADIKKGMNSLKYIHLDEDRKNTKKNYDRALKGESYSIIEIYGEKEKAFFESFFNPIFDVNNKIIGATGLARNSTDRVKSDEALKKSEEKYHTLFESNKDSITIFRIESDGKIGNFIDTNPATTELFGFSKKELLSLNITDLEQISDKTRKKRIESLISEGRIDFETIIKNKKGNKRNVEIDAILINYQNEPAVMNITRDITERKQLENNTKKQMKILHPYLKPFRNYYLK